MLEHLPGFLGRIGLALGMIALWVAALVTIYRRALTAQNAVQYLYRAIHDLAELPARLDQGLRNRMRRLFFKPRGAVLPAEVHKELERVMLARENAFEEEGGLKIVPNEYVVELHATTYEHHYRPQEKQLAARWRRWLVDLLDTTNNRYGENRYRFWGPVQVEIRAAPDLAQDQVRVLGRINAGVGAYLPPPGPSSRRVPPPPAAAPIEQAAPAAVPSAVARPAALVPCLELLPGRRRWPLHAALTTLGRSESADVHLDLAEIQQKRLISGQHAYIRCQDGGCRLFDGTPQGRGSMNGTFVNGRRVPPAGHELRDGDVIVLAAVDPDNPRPDLPGVAGLIFYENCR